MPRQPDKTEKGICFGCGAIFGLVVGFLTAAKFAGVDLASTIAITIVVSLSLGLLSMKYGSRFWEVILHWRWWT